MGLQFSFRPHPDPGSELRAHSRDGPEGARNLGAFKPYRLSTPITTEVAFKNYRPPQLLEYLPNVERVDSHTIRFTGQNMREVSDMLVFLNSYSTSLTP